MFERFTDRARRSVVLAQEESRRVKTNWIGPSHLLVGLIQEDGGIASQVLHSLGGTYPAACQWMDDNIAANDTISGHVPFTPKGKKIMELSLREALQLGHNYIGTEHLLLGLVREGECIELFEALGIPDFSTVRKAVIALLQKTTPLPTDDQPPRRPLKNSNEVTFRKVLLQIIRIATEALNTEAD